VRLTTVFRIALAAAAVLMLMRALPVSASDGDAARAREGVRTGRFVPADSLLDWIEARYLGRAIEVELEFDDDEPPTYEIEWLTPQNHVVEFEFDAHTGALLETEGRGLEEARKP
jgi:uncharacterized membrane protein YkoI